MCMQIPKEILERITWKKKKDPGEPDTIEELTYEEHQCKDCDRLVQKRCLHYSRCARPTAHWRARCSCGKWQDPISGKFTLTSNQLQNVARTVYKKR